MGSCNCPLFLSVMTFHLPVLILCGARWARHPVQRSLPCVCYIHCSLSFDLPRSHRPCFLKPSGCFYVIRYPSSISHPSESPSSQFHNIGPICVIHTCLCGPTSFNPAICLHFHFRPITRDISMSPFHTPKVFYLTCGVSTRLTRLTLQKASKVAFSLLPNATEVIVYTIRCCFSHILLLDAASMLRLAFGLQVGRGDREKILSLVLLVRLLTKYLLSMSLTQLQRYCCGCHVSYHVVFNSRPSTNLLYTQIPTYLLVPFTT